MTRELKQEYTLRITQANQTQLIIILYDITITYLNDALTAWNIRDMDEYRHQLLLAKKCIEEMINNLHFEYTLAKNLQMLYLSMKKTLREASLNQTKEPVESVINNLTKLKQAYETISFQDNSKPVMEHTQSVVAGLTYGKNSLSEDLSDESSNRGFRV